MPYVCRTNSPRHKVGTSCDELVSLACCSNNEVSTYSNIFIDGNLVEEIKKVKAQVTYLKKILEKSQKGKYTLNNIFSVQKSSHDKSELWLNHNNKKKSKSNNNKDRNQVKNSARSLISNARL